MLTKAHCGAAGSCRWLLARPFIGPQLQTSPKVLLLNHTGLLNQSKSFNRSFRRKPLWWVTLCEPITWVSQRCASHQSQSKRGWRMTPDSRLGPTRSAFLRKNVSLNEQNGEMEIKTADVRKPPSPSSLYPFLLKASPLLPPPACYITAVWLNSMKALIQRGCCRSNWDKPSPPSSSPIGSWTPGLAGHSPSHLPVSWVIEIRASEQEVLHWHSFPFSWGGGACDHSLTGNMVWFLTGFKVEPSNETRAETSISVETLYKKNPIKVKSVIHPLMFMEIKWQFYVS